MQRNVRYRKHFQNWNLLTKTDLNHQGVENYVTELKWEPGISSKNIKTHKGVQCELESFLQMYLLQNRGSFLVNLACYREYLS